MKELTHIVVEEQKTGFGKTSKKEIKVRLLKNHIVDEHGTKYRKDNGYLVGGRKWKGIYVASFSLDVSTLKPIKASNEKS